MEPQSTAVAAESKPYRPPVILVFGILTFVWCGFTLIGGMQMFAFTEIMPAAIPALIILLAGVKVAGVIRMFGMWKQGFYLYTFGELAGYLVQFWSNKYSEDLLAYSVEVMIEKGVSQSYIDSTLEYAQIGQDNAGWFLAISLAFSAAWIAVYGSQLKKMR